MFGGLRAPARRASRDQAEKPFWISFSDLMTSLMVLFMVAMAVALISITRGVNRIEEAKATREEAVAACMAEIAGLAQQPQFAGIAVRGHSLEFGRYAEYQRRSHELPADNQAFLRRLVPSVLAVARAPTCGPWLKRIVVEGFSSQEGSYLFNLNLSLQRSQRLLCALLDTRANDSLTEEDRRFIRRTFLVGGVSFNATKDRAESSRRIELKMEFRGIDEKPEELMEIPWDEDSRCPLDKEKGA
jgi:hypothetical protein